MSGKASSPFAVRSGLFSGQNPATHTIARELYAGVATLPIISHGTPIHWFADDRPFADPAET